MFLSAYFDKEFRERPVYWKRIVFDTKSIDYLLYSTRERLNLTIRMILLEAIKCIIKVLMLKEFTHLLKQQEGY